MKRFWNEALAEQVEGGWTVTLDGKRIKTPGQFDMVVPGERLARAMAQEWQAVEGKIDPSAMPMTGLTNAAVERIAPHREAFATDLAQHGETELCCYRADGPESLCAAQCAAWDPLLEWAAGRYGVTFETTAGIIHVAQPAATVERMRAAVMAEDPFHLAGLAPMVTIGGSLVAALAVREREFDPELAWDAVEVDASYQRENWGADADADTRNANRKRDFMAGARFLSLL